MTCQIEKEMLITEVHPSNKNPLLLLLPRVILLICWRCSREAFKISILKNEKIVKRRILLIFFQLEFLITYKKKKFVGNEHLGLKKMVHFTTIKKTPNVHTWWQRRIMSETVRASEKEREGRKKEGSYVLF